MTRRPATALLLAGALLAGCGAAEPGLVQLRHSAETPAAAAEIAGFTWAVPREPRSLDWPQGGEAPEDTVTANLCEPLAALAAEIGNPEPLTHVYRLRPGVRLHDGTTLTAADAVASLRRSADRGSGGRLSRGFDKVESITETGPLEVTLRLRVPDPLLSRTLAGRAGTVASREYLAAGAPSTSDGCSGPFRLAEWAPGSHILLTRFEDYWNPAARALAGAVRFTFASGPALVNGLLDASIEGSYLDSPTAVLRLGHSTGGRVYFGHGNAVAALDPVPGGALDNPRRRRALALALDRKAIAREGFAGLAQPADPPVPEGGGTILAAGPSPRLPLTVLDEARQLVAETEPLGQDLVIQGGGGVEAVATAAEVLAACTRIGLPARIGSEQPDLALVSGAPTPADPAWTRWIPLVQLPNTLYLNHRITGAPTGAGYLDEAWAARIGRSRR
ncbi:ABC transporter substrate-binding protein [Crossiella sp. SN42]|uniref:ABC transporter substrate-binding protein n=1 Tax=Crossiella sp. SN42 TaxID=2944808 RepID=UPI00207D140F|nr:ABC transporter substrate-binding protein [Crossiella sp. SN42]MCO1581473.1 ABC transporter substrate-binding protein [Crossiella sp. SN42]